MLLRGAGGGSFRWSSSVVLVAGRNWGAVFAAFFEAEDDRAGPRPKCADARGEDDTSTDRYKDFHPEAGSCLIFRSRELWHEMLPAHNLQFAFTLFAQHSE